MRVKAAAPQPGSPGGGGRSDMVTGARWVLRGDGGAVAVRELTGADRDVVAALHAALPPEDDYLRFFTVSRSVGRRYADSVLPADDRHRTLGAFADGELVGCAGYVLQPDGTAEFALVVGHGDQAHGVGTLPVEQLVALARAHGVATFVADVLATAGDAPARAGGRACRAVSTGERRGGTKVPGGWGPRPVCAPRVVGECGGELPEEETMQSDFSLSQIDPLVAQALRAAVRAPSVHNTQPWRFVVRADRVDVRLDRDRVLAVADPDAHEARLSCGAAVLNMRLAIAARGRAAEVAVLPDRLDPDLLAVVRVGLPRRATAAESALAGAIERRHTNRRPFLDRAVPFPVRSALVAAASAEGAGLRVFDRPADLAAVADIVRRADHAQSEDAAHGRELRAWIADEGRADGVPRSAIGRVPSRDSVLTVRDFAPRDAAGVVFESRPLVAVLTTVGDTPGDHVVAGQALQRVLLAAEAAGLAAAPLSQPIEVPAARAALRAVVGAAPHVVLRLGFGYPGVPTPRRPLAAVVTIVDEAPTDVPLA
ncbi:Acg family FMN-binding oxidoreductase [Actinokineospora iranica]|uniref:N-acetyltransferase domain-containing protein n=1 Tax=Actinokineospora iranica TaxID=1271860 RepID=A0A1G6JS17_9PSEU|nr:GNAT family N-acetyltransferase [Actinokineospora iranica]SDC21542.1 hypothetical protein SAMN05216174_101535 [Actinokineospora iranica]